MEAVPSWWKDIASDQMPSTSAVSDAAPAVGVRTAVIGEAAEIVRAPRPVIGKAKIAAIVQSESGGLPGLADFLDETEPGDFLVFGMESTVRASTFGGLAARRCSETGVVGVVSGGWVRDVTELTETQIPIWAAGATPQSGRGRLAIDVRDQIELFGHVVHSTDAVYADATGLCIFALEALPEVIDQAASLERIDQEVGRLLSNGISFSDATSRVRTR